MTNYKIAKEILSEAEKDRILCIWLNSTPSETDWATATQEYGAASAESMKKCVQNAMKKLEKAVADGYEPTGETGTPKTSAKKGRKRKADVAADDAGATPSKTAKKAESKGGNEETSSAMKEEAADGE